MRHFWFFGKVEVLQKVKSSTFDKENFFIKKFSKVLKKILNNLELVGHLHVPPFVEQSQYQIFRQIVLHKQYDNYEKLILC